MQYRPWNFRATWQRTIETVEKQPFADVVQNRCLVLKISQYSHQNALIKLQAFSAATFFKKDSNTVVFCGYCEFFKKTFFYRTPPVAAFNSLTTAQLSHLSALWFRASTCFRFWSKTYKKRWTSNFFLAWIDW